MSKSLPSPNLSEAEGWDLAAIVIKKLWEDRTNDQFELYWEDIMKKKKFLNVRDPILPRRRKLSEKFDERESYGFPSIPKYFFKNIYFEVYDRTIYGVRELFDQLDYQIYVNLQELKLQAFNREDSTGELERVINFNDGRCSH